MVGLGAPIEKIILNTPAFGNSFNLMSKDKNLPGSATTGLPQTVTYQQVHKCNSEIFLELNSEISQQFSI